MITVDQRPLVLHLLIGLCRAGLERAVVAVGDGAELIEAAVREAELPIQVSYVTVPPSLWRNLANSILMCKAAFKTDEPLLIVRADQLYDWRVLRKIACAPFVPGIDAFALVDPAPETLEWASGALCGPSCKHAGNTGRCNALVKVARGADGRAVRCGCMLHVPPRRRHSSHACAPRTGSPRRGLPRTLGTRLRAARGPMGPAAAVALGRGRPRPRCCALSARTSRNFPPTLLRPATPRCGHRLGSFDAVVAGDVYASRPKIFEIMARLAQENMYSATTAPRPGACGSCLSLSLSLTPTRYSAAPGGHAGAIPKPKPKPNPNQVQHDLGGHAGAGSGGCAAPPHNLTPTLPLTPINPKPNVTLTVTLTLPLTTASA